MAKATSPSGVLAWNLLILEQMFHRPRRKFSHGAWERVVSTSQARAAGTRVKVDGP